MHKQATPPHSSLSHPLSPSTLPRTARLLLAHLHKVACTLSHTHNWACFAQAHAVARSCSARTMVLCARAQRVHVCRARKTACEHAGHNAVCVQAHCMCSTAPPAAAAHRSPTSQVFVIMSSARTRRCARRSCAPPRSRPTATWLGAQRQPEAQHSSDLLTYCMKR